MKKEDIRKVHCFFEQSGTFKNEFIRLGIPAEDYDIQNNFSQTDHVVDLFAEIERGYNNEPSVFDHIGKGDLIMAFFPCIHFCAPSQMWFSITNKDYRKWDAKRIIDYICKKNQDRAYFFEILNKFVGICLIKNLRMIFENPYAMQTHLKCFLKKPDVIDNNRMIRGDYMVKPTAYWFWNCEPTHGLTIQRDKKRIDPMRLPSSKKQGLCSEERSMISPDYARNFICDFIIGKEQVGSQMSLFD